jgi:hypothetical protein
VRRGQTSTSTLQTEAIEKRNEPAAAAAAAAAIEAILLKSRHHVC